MADSANVRSIDAVRYFHAAVVNFQEEARLCVSALEMQLLRIIGWLERDRPGFWKREIESCYRAMADARVSLHKCKMRRVGDFRPTCFEEQKALEKAKKDLQFAEKQIPVVKYWCVCAHQEANEFHGRASQLTRMVERELPRLMALLQQSVDRLEAYNNVQVVGRVRSVGSEANAMTAQQTVDSTESCESESESSSREPVEHGEHKTPESIPAKLENDQ